MLDLEGLSQLDAAFAGELHVVAGEDPGPLMGLSGEGEVPDQVRDASARCPHLAWMAAE